MRRHPPHHLSPAQQLPGQAGPKRALARPKSPRPARSSPNAIHSDNMVALTPSKRCIRREVLLRAVFRQGFVVILLSPLFSKVYCVLCDRWLRQESFERFLRVVRRSDHDGVNFLRPILRLN